MTSVPRDIVVHREISAQPTHAPVAHRLSLRLGDSCGRWARGSEFFGGLLVEEGNALRVPCHPQGPADTHTLWGWGAGLKEKCVDSLVFETLIPKPMMQHYISLLLKHRRLVLSGPSGTGKTYLTNRLAEYLVERSGREVTEGIVSTFNMHQQSCKVAASWEPGPAQPPVLFPPLPLP